MPENEPTIEELQADLIIARAYVTCLQRTIQELVHPPDAPMDAEDQRLQIRHFEDATKLARGTTLELQVMVLGVRALLDQWTRPCVDARRFELPYNWPSRIGKILESDSLGWPGGLPEWKLEKKEDADFTEKV